MLMDATLHNDSSLLPICFVVILLGFVEEPVIEFILFVDLIAWMRRASLPCTPTADETFVSIQVGADCPLTSFRFYKEVEIRGAFHFQPEHLQRKLKVL